MTQLETFYMFLDSAWQQMPPRSHPRFAPALKELLDLVASEIAMEADPKSMSDVRAYAEFDDDERIQRHLVAHVLEKSPEVEHDPNLVHFEMLRALPIHEVIQAPVESPSELALWIAAAVKAAGAKGGARSRRARL